MADVANTSPIDNNPEGGNNIPPNNVDDPNGNNELGVKELIENQMKVFQNNFITQFNKEYSDKLTKLQSDNLELEGKKQRLIIGEELRAADLDGSLIDFVYDKDIEVSKMKITQLKELINAAAERKVHNKLKEFSYVPGSNDENFIQNKEKPKYFI